MRFIIIAVALMAMFSTASACDEPIGMVGTHIKKSISKNKDLQKMNIKTGRQFCQTLTKAAGCNAKMKDISRDPHLQKLEVVKLGMTIGEMCVCTCRFICDEPIGDKGEQIKALIQNNEVLKSRGITNGEQLCHSWKERKGCDVKLINMRESEPLQNLIITDQQLSVGEICVCTCPHEAMKQVVSEAKEDICDGQEPNGVPGHYLAALAKSDRKLHKIGIQKSSDVCPTLTRIYGCGEELKKIEALSSVQTLEVVKNRMKVEEMCQCTCITADRCAEPIGQLGLQMKIAIETNKWLQKKGVTDGRKYCHYLLSHFPCNTYLKIIPDWQLLIKGIHHRADVINGLSVGNLCTCSCPSVEVAVGDGLEEEDDVGSMEKTRNKGATNAFYVLLVAAAVLLTLSYFNPYKKASDPISLELLEDTI